VSAFQEDTDTDPGYGPYVNYIIFIQNGLIRELQVYKDDGHPISCKLDASRIVAVIPRTSGP
jgi:hypothetical protein